MYTNSFQNSAAPDPEITPQPMPEENPTPEIPTEDPAPLRSPEFPEPDLFPSENPVPNIQPEYPGTPASSPEIQRF